MVYVPELTSNFLSCFLQIYKVNFRLAARSRDFVHCPQQSKRSVGLDAAKETIRIAHVSGRPSDCSIMFGLIGYEAMHPNVIRNAFCNLEGGLSSSRNIAAYSACLVCFAVTGLF